MDFYLVIFVGDYIYMIGNLGYVLDCKLGFMFVYCLNIYLFKIEWVEIRGDMLGWIYG